MAYFMRFFKKISFEKLSFKSLNAASLLVLLLMTSPLGFAAGNSIEIESAELQLQDNHYTLDADVEINFDKDIEEAINKGVPLSFLVEFQIVSPRKYWFDDEVVTATQAVTLSYHALTRQYLVNRNSHQQSFETLSEAKQAVVNLEDWKVIEKSLLDKNEAYRAALLIRLDQSKLPKAIQVEAIGSEKWNLTSEKFEWALKELNTKEPVSKEPVRKEPATKEPASKEPASKELKP